MSPQSLIALLLLLILIGLSTRPSVRTFIERQNARLSKRARRSSPAPTVSTGTTVITANGEEVPILEPDEQTPRMSRWGEGSTRRWRIATVVVAALIGLLIAVQVYQSLTRPTEEQFVVLVAPFQEPDGSVGQTGRAVAAALVANLPQSSGGRVVVRSIDQPPASADAALDIVRRAGADALIWGAVEPGGMPDRPSLQPMLLYQPSGAVTPNGWDGYAGRFDMPTTYRLASAPINGEVVLPGLLGALADYNAGHVDAAFTTLGALLDNYSALLPALPRALRGNILWARGDYQAAAAEYRRAVSTPVDEQSGPQLAPLYNNLGAILQDADDATAQDVFSQATSALNGRDLGALRYNLGLQALHDNRAADAVTSLEVARSLSQLTPALPTAPLLLKLGEAYRLNGLFGQAQTALDDATRSIAAAANATTPELRTLVTTRLTATAEEQRALLKLAQAANARGSLLWELESADPLPPDALTGVEDDLKRSADDTRTLAQYWTRLSALKDAADEPIAGQIATNHAQRAQALLRERQRWQAALEIERGQISGVMQPRGLMSVWSFFAGDRTPIGQGRALLMGLVAAQPADVDSLVLLGRSYLLQGNLDAANKQFTLAATAAPQRPEPVYGQAQVALPSDRARARQLLTQAIALDADYFPARRQLAEIAEQDGDWATAIEQRRWLAQHRPSDANQLALAQALRGSGMAGYAAAEQELLPLANRNHVGALLLLSEIYQARGNAQAARDMLERAQRAAPRDPDVAFAFGQFLEQQGLPGAEDEYLRAVAANPNHVPSHLALGRLYAAQKKSAQATEQYNAALAAGADDPDELQAIGAVLLENGEYDSAATAYQRGIDANATNPQLYLLYHGLGQANLRRGQLDAAQTAEQHALDLQKGAYPEALVALGDIALQRGKPDDAVQQYNAALKLNPQLTAAYLGLGHASAAVGSWSVAQAHFNDAVRSDNGSAEAHLWLGEALIRQPDANGAIAEYVQALKLKRDYPEAYFGLAQAQIANAQNDVARQNLASALALRPAYPEALLLQGKLNEQQGDDNAAIQSYGQAISASSLLAEPHYRRALLYIRHDQLDAAVDDLESAISIQSNFPEAHYWLGRAYLAQSTPKTARAQFALAITQRGGTYADAQFYQGLAEEQLGLRDNAVASYQAALTQDRNGVWASEANTALNRLRQP